VLEQLVGLDVAADLDIAEEAKARLERDLLEGARDRLDLRMVGCDAEPDEAPRCRQALDQVDLDRDVGAEQRRGRIEAGRAGANDCDTQSDRRMGIPGEDLPGSWAATEFVAWYNGHPDYQELEFDLSGDRAVVIGNGNVAVDVARMLALTPEELAPTDTTHAAITAFDAAGIREIVMVGRRGPAQAAFTTPELIELGELAGADVIVDPADLEGAEPTDTNSERNLAVLREYAAREPEGKPKRLVLRFLLSPVAILGDDRVEGIELVHNRLEADASGALRAVATGEMETLECGIVFRSVGYRGVALPGVPFDESRGTIANENGRVAPGVYVAGWIKRGPSGVIGTNKKDAAETVELLLADLRDAPRNDRPAEELDRLLVERGVRPVVHSGWTSIDELERAAGEELGRPRVKLVTWAELLEAAQRIPQS
jgi:ferredoxin/flavodoxin---NADP+ reductase